MSVIATVEDAILAVVNETLPNKLRDSGSLPGAWSIDLLRLLLNKAPAVYVSFNGGTFEKTAGLALINARFDVYLVTKEPTEVNRRRGAVNVIGAYEMIEALAPALNGLTIAGCGSLRAESITNWFREVLIDLGGTVYGMQFSLPRLSLSSNGVDLSLLADFAVLNVSSDINGDGVTDFVTNVNLPQGG